MSRFRLIAPLVVAICVALLLAAPATPLWAQSPAYDYRECTLDNGLRVITLRDDSCPIVSVQVWYHVGSKNEQADRQGFAHMFEHMMFRGTDRLGPTDHFNLVRQTGGSTNAYTSFDMTVYLETLPANQLELALWLEAERMAFLRIDQESFDTERKVVEEERRMGLNRPFGTLMEKTVAELFKVHPYRWTPIGNIPHLRATKVEELRAFWNRFYVPNNATLVVVGDIEHQPTQKLAAAYFGWIPRVDDPPRVTLREPMPTARRKATIREENAPVPMVMLAYRTVPIAHDDAVALQLLSNILTGGESSRLYRDLVAEKQAAVAVQSMEFSLEHDGVLGIIGVMGPGGDKSDQLVEAIETHVARLHEQPVTERELLKAKNNMLKGLVAQNLTINSKSRTLGHAAVIEGDLSRVNQQLDGIRDVTADDLQRAARTYLTAERCLEVRVPANLLGSTVGKLLDKFRGNKDDETEAQPAESTDDAQPADQPPPKSFSRPESFPAEPPLAGVLEASPRLDHSRHTLPNGLQLLVVPNHEVPLVSVQLRLLGGSWTEQQVGAASMAMQMLLKGTEKHDEAELAEELDTYAIALAGSANNDSAHVAASCLTEHLPRTVRLLAEVVRTPTFPADELEKLRKQVRTGLAMRSAEPSYIAQRELSRRLYGEHPYARTPTGELDDVDALDVDDLRTWWQQAVRPDMAVLIVAGDVQQQQAIDLATDVLGDWQVDTPGPESELPGFPAAGATHIYLVDRPGSVQSQIRVGQLGLTRRDSGFFTSVLVSDYFGGAFDSRLNEAVRVQKGLTYGARGGFQARRFGGAITASTFTKTASTAEALQTVLDEIARLRTDPPAVEELKRRQTYYLGSFALKRETPQQVASDLWLIHSHGLPADHFDAMLDAIRGASPDDCLQLAQQRIDPSQLVIVIVGDAAELKADLEKIAPVTVVKP